MGGSTAKTVLIIEDDAAILKILSRNIAEHGFKVFTSEDGQDGFDLAVKNIPDLILLDLQLPSIKGTEVLKKIRENSKIKHTPIIILTNDATSESMDETLDGGAPAYFIKSETSLTTVVDAVLFHLNPV